MEKQKKIIDASVIVKWFAKEVNSEAAVLIRERHIEEEIEIIIPELAVLETLNALRYKNNTEEFLEKTNKDLWDSQLTIECTTQNIAEKSIKIAKQYDITLYDAVYVALAQLHGAYLITDDKELAKIPNVILLEDYKG